ncbi:hypothetical protein B0H13DRAFT_2665584 [Mycena leptocephala]|nr:hypothetical protein B0H13DRAFT_2665584 [Mycena leptocephala]
MECLTLPCHKLPDNQALAGGVTVIEDAPAYYASRLQWSRLEIGSFWNAFAGAKKDFSAISKCIGKPASECIEFYYLNKRHLPLELAEASDTNLPQKGDDPISNTRAASIDADGSIWFRSSNGYSPPSIRWSKRDQETFHEITNKFTNVLPGPGFKIPVESNVLLAFKRIAAQMPHMTTAQVLEFCYWQMNPTRFKDAYLIYDLH